MSTPTLVSGRRMLKTADWLFSVEQEAQDNAALIAYDRRERIEREVSFDDLLMSASVVFLLLWIVSVCGLLRLIRGAA
jgi:hypothetical protein